MGVREKLVEWLADLDCNAEYCKDCEFADDIDGCVRRQKEIIADHLIANGVTVQRWIPVTERLPGTEKVLITNGDIVMRGYRRPDGVWKYGIELHEVWERLSLNRVTHWMPLPELPKEGE